MTSTTVSRHRSLLTASPLSHAVHSQPGVLLPDLLGLDGGDFRHGVEAAVLGQGQGDALQGIGESTERVLLHGGNLEERHTQLKTGYIIIKVIKSLFNEVKTTFLDGNKYRNLQQMQIK